MKTTLLKSLATATLLAGSFNAFSQANDWILPPSTKIHFTTSSGTASTLPGTSAISGCGAGPTYLFQQRASTISPGSSGSGMVFVDNCGIYNLSGTNIGSGTYQNVFYIPGQCKQYYAIGWESVFGPPHGNKLTIRTLDATNPAAITETTSADLINDGYAHSGISIAVAPLDSNGSRRVYISDGNTLKLLTIAANGSYGSLANIKTLTNQLDSRTNMEVTPDGKKLLMLDLSGAVLLQDLVNITSSPVTLSNSLPIVPGGSVRIISGFEYVPMAGSGDRVYISFHSWTNYINTVGGLYYVPVANPAAPVDVFTTATVSPPYSGFNFGFSEIERGKDGKLYLAMNPNALPNAYGYYTVSSGGPMYVLNTGTNTISPLMNGSTAVNGNNYEGNWGYFIQGQIDGENYSLTNYSVSPPSFTVNGVDQGPFIYPTSVPSVYLCNDSLKLNASLIGAHTSYTLKIETGTVAPAMFGSFSSWAFTANPIQPTLNTVTTPSTAPSVLVNLVNSFPWLANYRGPFRVTMTSNNPCSSATSSLFFNLVDPTDFLMIAPIDGSYYSSTQTFNSNCTSTPRVDPVTGSVTRPSYTGALDRKVITPGSAGPSFFAAGVINPASIPPCYVGWMGASSVGVINGDLNASVGSATNYKILVEEFDQPHGNDSPLVFRQVILNRNLPATGIPASGYIFDGKTNPTPANAHYFTDITNYDAIKNRYVYRVTYSATGSCGTIRSYSYFKILSDGLTGDANGGVNWRGAPGNGSNTTLPGNGQFKAYPNPATTALTLSWNSSVDAAASVTISDMLGQVVLKQILNINKGQNANELNVAGLAPGVYHYTVSMEQGMQQGNFVKK